MLPKISLDKAILLIIEIILFASFIWALIFWFKKTLIIKRWELTFIKISGIVFVALHLGAALIHPLPSNSIFIVGVTLLIISMLLFFSSIHAFSSPPAVAFAAENIVPLNTKGPYCYIRHPFYTSYLLAWLGGSLASGFYYLLVSFFIMVIIYYRAAKEEERIWLSSSCAENYSNYKSATGMFLPNINTLLCR